MYAAVGIVDDLLPRDSDGVFLGLNLQFILLDARQLDDGQNLVALLKNVDGWEWALAGSLVLKPLASGAGFKRSLEVKKGVERVGVCCVHNRTRVGATFENGKTSRPSRVPIWLTSWHCQERSAKNFYGS